MFARKSRIYFAILGWAVISCAGSFVAAQEQLGNKDNTTNPFINPGFKNFLQGTAKDADPAKDKKLLDNAANYFVYRVTWPTLQGEKYENGMGLVQTEFKNLMNHTITQKGDNKDFMKVLAPVLVERFKDVLKLDFKTNTTAVTNAALMLPLLARCKQPAVHDFLLALAKEDPAGKPGKAFIRMCAIKGLGELNSPHGPVVINVNVAAEVAAERQREQARAEAIWEFIQQPYPPEGESDAHKDAFSFVRREGVKALAQLRVPAFSVQKGEAKGPVAYYLLYVASGGTPKGGPPFTLSEKIEAAIGLCLLDAKETKEYKPELAAYVVTNVLADMARAYDDDSKFFSIEPKKGDPKRQPLLPWQSYALRLDDGLKKLQNNWQGAAKADALKSTAITGLLKKIGDRKEIESPDAVRQAAASLRPASFEVYQGCKEPVLLLPEK